MQRVLLAGFGFMGKKHADVYHLFPDACVSAGPILQVKSGSVTVPVYRCGDGRLPRFFIAYYRNGQRVRQSFLTIDEAKRETQVAARQIAAGLAKATGLSIAEREAYDAGKGDP